MPTPENLHLPNINPVPKMPGKPFGRGNPPAKGRGRKRGEINKVTRDIKNGVHYRG